MTRARQELAFEGLAVRVPAGWQDITDDLDEGVPYTLARDGGHGALQFSTALYESGVRPAWTAEVLMELALEKARRPGAAPTFDAALGPGLLAGVSCRLGGAFLRVWYASDGPNVACITYVCDWDDRAIELAEAEEIVRSARFEAPPG